MSSSVDCKDDGFRPTVNGHPKVQLNKWKVIALVLGSISLICVGFTLAMVLSKKCVTSSDYVNETITHTTEKPLIFGNDETTLNKSKLKIVPKKDWLAMPVHATLDALHTPVPYVVISHSASEGCSTQAQCVLSVRIIQTFHIESRGWWDIGFNFLVGGDGSAYVGRGWDAIGAHTYGYNNKSIGINFIGNFNDVLPPERQILAAQLLIEEGVQLGKIRSDYKVLAHRQVSATQSPGSALFENMKTWPHWSEIP